MLVDQQKREVENHTGNPVILTWPSVRPTRFQDACFLSRVVRKQQPDCLISNFGAVNLTTLVGWGLGVKHRIVWHHTMSSAVDADGLKPPWKLGLLRWRKRQVWRFATAIAAVSRAAKDDLQATFHVPARKCHVIYNCLKDPLEGKSISKSLSRENRILCVGRFHRSKGQSALLRALALLKPHFPTLGAEFIGDGPLRGECERLAAELRLTRSCHFAGSLPHDRVLNAMARSDVTVVPSRSEAFGLVAMESLAMGTPVIASSVGGLPEILGDNLGSWLVPPDDPEAIADRLRHLLTDAAGYVALSALARVRFLDQFEQSTAVRRLADWLESLLVLRACI